jgi:hypothetical protein
MPKNFDEILEQDRKFTIGGQEFTWRYMHPMEFASWIDDGAERELARLAEAAKRAEDAVDGEIDQNSDRQSMRKGVEDIIEDILRFLIEDDRDRFSDMVGNEVTAPPYPALRELRAWLQEAQTGRPTEQPSTSSPGRGRPVATSKAA